MQILIPLIIFFLIVIALVTVPIAIIRIHLFKLRREQESLHPLKVSSESAILANSTVVSVFSQNLADSTRTVVRVDLRLEVHLPGGELYQAKTSWLVNVTLLPKLQPGEDVSVKIDPSDPKVIFPNMQGAEYYFWN